MSVTDLETEFAGATIAGDCHFASGKKAGTVEGVRFLVPYAHVSEEAGATPQQDDMTKKKRKYNEIVREVRARVESPFGLIKKRWLCLEQPWREGEQQQESVVLIAIACENDILVHKK
eukprot:TRINITY_DN12034_c0_g1_i1.p1 TRINITY_DN12034_c0_g1~~TRINITY_DN12034_c0_g1_i1.p1  ORF type:complete len:118 (+),score=13.43 TRINITY_DN12034_c0_g1_i1:240-593(+)